MLPSQNRLRRTADVAQVRQSGQRWQHALVVLFVNSSSHEAPTASRFAFAVGRHLGPAHRRNRIKRRLREIVRLRLGQVRPGFDCLLVARHGAAAATHEELERAVVQLLARGGLLRPNDEP